MNASHLTEKNLRVVILSPSLAPYRVILFQRLGRLPGVQLHLIFDSSVAQYAKAQLDLLPCTYSLLPSRVFRVKNQWADKAGAYLTPSLWQHLGEHSYDVLITLGWTNLNSLLALAHSKLHSRAVVLWEDSISHWAGWLKRFLMPLWKIYLGAFDAYIASSNGTIEYLVEMGARRERIALMPLVADNDFFAAESTRYRLSREELKQELGIHTQYLILFVGQLTARKGVTRLLDAFRDIASARNDVSLMLVGRGPLREELLARRAAFGLQERVFIQDFAPQTLLPKYYALADVFVLPSVYDAFGVVVCEAMACGLPIVTTNTVGATSNIVQDGVNGLIVPPQQTQPLADALLNIIGDEALRAKMSAESRRIIAGWNVDLSAQNFLRGMELVAKPPHVSAIHSPKVGAE
ncbi:MAG TPA: glycosyltransferase family 4 protein [Anaerolineae bacterium]|nr:glycosyltransferase family 4 protein [Anaerolineae bacterium]